MENVSKIYLIFFSLCALSVGLRWCWGSSLESAVSSFSENVAARFCIISLTCQSHCFNEPILHAGFVCLSLALLHVNGYVMSQEHFLKGGVGGLIEIAGKIYE